MNAPRACLLLLLVASLGHAVEEPGPAGAGLVERLGVTIPPGLAFTDQDGHPRTFAELCGDGKPLLLIPAYYRCPMLCGLVLRGAVAAARGIDWVPGDRYRIAVFSFDPGEGPAEAVQKQRAVLAEGAGDARFAAAAWPFLTADDATITSLMTSIGERAQRLDGGEYAHPAVMVVVGGDGVIRRYLSGIDLPPRDLKLALMEAGAGRSASLAERALLYCYRYDPATHRYGLFIAWFLRIGGLVVLAASVLLIRFLVARVRRRAPA